MKVGDIVRVDEDFHEFNVITKDYLADCVITKLEKIFVDDDVPLLATVERCDGEPYARRNTSVFGNQDLNLLKKGGFSDEYDT